MLYMTHIEHENNIDCEFIEELGTVPVINYISGQGTPV